MRKFILFSCAMFMLALGFSSCGDDTTRTWSKTEIEEISKESSAAAVYDLVNPTFVAVDEAVADHEALSNARAIDSVFVSLSPSVIRNVASVCIGKSSAASRRQIVEEYTKNRSIYTNLPSTTDNNGPATFKDNKSATGDGESGVTKDNGTDGKVFSTEYSYHTDTVDGKPVRVQTKVEKSYVK